MPKPLKDLTPQNQNSADTVELLITPRYLECTNKARLAAQHGYYVTIFWTEALIALEAGLKVCLVLNSPFTKQIYSELYSHLAAHSQVCLPDFDTLISKPASLDASRSRFLIITIISRAAEEVAREISPTWLVRRANSF